MKVWVGISMEGLTDIYRLDSGTLTAIRYQDEILAPIVKPYTGAVGPGFLLVQDSVWPLLARASGSSWKMKELISLTGPYALLT